MKKNRKPLIIACAISAILVLWMLSGVFSHGKAKKAEATKETTSAFRVRAVESSAQMIVRESEVNARTEANRDVILRAEVGGRVQKIGAARGSRVKEGDLVVAMELREREARLAQAKATLEERRMQLDSATKLAAKGMQSRAELATAQSSYESADAELTLAKLDLERAEVCAPFSSALVERYAEKGDYLSIGDEIALVADLDPIVVKGYMTEREISGVHVGNEATAKLATGEKLSGSITYISPDADKETRMYQVEMRAPNSDYAVRSGVTAQMYVPHDRISAHFISPAYLLLADDGTIGVMLADADGTTHFASISIVKTGKDGLWISGLPEKTIIITSGKDFVSPGQKVELVLDTPATVASAQ
jgi:multidrug efflux system membrane fusion protein